ncbi:hypothetical protein DES44_2007 [Roseateles depolymerans]|uniref:Uncharacterized protein n=2 Tax=Roseateles depolymerans TaxID=76731 RepID=A0A0U3MDZ9_9BURK|nr:hypothetical protein RD2015_2061 [Roseateles depolymerans]REG19511.1 hypothetical protein DES44_2007 [Roseateles depolymerans]
MFQMPPPHALPAPVLAELEAMEEEAIAPPLAGAPPLPGSPVSPTSPHPSGRTRVPDLNALLGADAPGASCAPGAPGAPGARDLPSPQPRPIVLDTLTRQVDKLTRLTFQRFEDLSRRLVGVLTEDSMAADSRLSVVNEVLEDAIAAEMEDEAGPRAQAAMGRRRLQALRTANKLMDQLEKIRTDGHPRELEFIRRVCLSTAQRMRIAPELDPDFLNRIVQVDLRPVDEAMAIEVDQGHNPYRRFRPEFSCWKDAPVPPSLPPWEPPARAMSSARLLVLWNRWTEAGLCFPFDAFERFLYDRDAGPRDVEAILAPWMALPTPCAVAVMTSDAKVVAVRVGTPAAERVFAGRADHELARYCPYTRTLVVGVKATGGPGRRSGDHSDDDGDDDASSPSWRGPQPRLEIPSTQLAHSDGRPPRFWMEVGRMVVDGWNDPAHTVGGPSTAVGPDTTQGLAASKRVPASRRFESVAGRCAADCELDLPQGSFLEALAVAAENVPLGFPLGVSEEETHARVVALHLCGMHLPLELEDYVVTRLQATQGA